MIKIIRSSKCFEDREWKELLEDCADQSQTQKLTRHLDSCDSCRDLLEELAATRAMWIETTSVLANKHVDDQFTNSINSNDSYLSSNFLKKWLKPSVDPKSLGVIDHYEVLRVLGAGGMGVVVEAFDPSLHRNVAIKFLHPHLASMGVARQRFAREARAAAAVVHPHVVPIHSVVSESDSPYLVMSYIPGESLQERLDRVGSLPIVDCLRIASQVADGLAAAHANVLVHRDVKPANILLEAGTARVWLTDFGLARTLDDATMTASGLIAGTPQFMSPEQANGDAIDHRSDLFSLGSVLYTMLAGRAAFRAESSLAILRRIVDQEPRPLCEIRPEVPLWLEAIVAKLQSKQIADRFGEASEVSELLRQCTLHMENPQQVPLPSEATKLARRLSIERNSQTRFKSNSSNRIAWAIATVASVGLITFIGWALFIRSFNNSSIATQGQGGSMSSPKASADGSPFAIQQSRQNPEWNLNNSDLDSIESEIVRLNLPFFHGIPEYQENE